MAVTRGIAWPSKRVILISFFSWLGLLCQIESWNSTTSEKFRQSCADSGALPDAAFGFAFTLKHEMHVWQGLSQTSPSLPLSPHSSLNFLPRIQGLLCIWQLPWLSLKFALGNSAVSHWGCWCWYPLFSAGRCDQEPAVPPGSHTAGTLLFPCCSGFELAIVPRIKCKRQNGKRAEIMHSESSYWKRGFSCIQNHP